VGALVLKPDTRTWLLRRLGLEPEDRRWFEEDDAQPAEHEGDEPLDTREARFSLRARLAEEGLAEPPATAPPLAAAPPPAPEPEPTEPAETAEDAPISAGAEVADPVVDEPVAADPVEEPVAEEPVAEEPVAAAPVVEEPAAEAPVAGAPSEPPDAEAPAAPAPAALPDRPWAPPVAVPEPEPEPVPARALAFESVPAIGPEDDAPKSPGEDTSEIEQPEESPYLTFQAPAVVPDLPAEDDEHAPPPPTPLRPPTSPASPSRPFSESTSFRSAIDAARERVHGAAREATPDEGESTEPLDERDS
jgi:hypothetical protein